MAQKATIFVEHNNKQISISDALHAIKEAWTATGNLKKDLKKIKLYAKPEDEKIYFVAVNDFDCKEVKGYVTFTNFTVVFNHL